MDGWGSKVRKWGEKNSEIPKLRDARGLRVEGEVEVEGNLGNLVGVLKSRMFF